MKHQYIVATALGLLVLAGTSMIAAHPRLETGYFPAPGDVSGGGANYSADRFTTTRELVAIRLDPTSGRAHSMTTVVAPATMAPLRGDSIVVQQVAPTVRERTPLEVIWTLAPWRQTPMNES